MENTRNVRLHVIYGSLIAVLVVVSAYSMYAAIDTAITLSYRDQQASELEAVRKQLMSVLPVLSRDRSKAEIITALEQASGEKAWEKDGCLWVGMVGVKFSVEEKLLHVSPTWSYGEPDPCFPP